MTLSPQAISPHHRHRIHKALLTFSGLLVLVIALGFAPHITPEVAAHGGFFDIRLNTGGPAQTVNGVEWLGCPSQSNCYNYVSGGFSYTKMPLVGVSPIVSPANEFIYQSEWTGGSTTGVPAGGVAFAFNVPMPNGDYTVRLHFAEVVQNGAGLRTFDVQLEGNTVLSNFDVFQAAGGINKGIVREFDRTITDGVVNIQFIRRVNNAKISGIEIIHKDETTPPPPTEEPLVPLATEGFTLRLNTGGAAQSVSGVNWAGCTGSCSGYVSGGFGFTASPLPTISPVVSPANQAIYQSEWTGGSTTGIPDGGVAFAFNVTVPNGNYTVRLHFAELNRNGVGLRTFDVRLEGTTVLSNFDIFQQAGGLNKGIVREFQPSVADGTLNIQFIRRIQNAKISGIEIIQIVDGTPPPPPPPPPPPSSDYFDVRINTGGLAQTVNGINWIGCNAVASCSNYVTGGFAFTPNPPATISPVVSPANQTIYQSEWTGGSTTGIPVGGVAFSFEVPIINGNYMIRLHFAELNQSSVGGRVFDVKIEGSTVLSNFDIFQQAGGANKGIVREFQRTITDSRVNIEFIRRVNNAKISGIEIVSLNPTSTGGQALFVVGSTVLNSGDAKIKTRLENMGFTVQVIQDTAATQTTTTGKNLVVISSTVGSGNIGNRLTNVTVPILNWEPFLQDDLQMVGTSLGSVSGQTQLTIVAPSHPLAAGLSGNVTTTSSSSDFTWGQPSSGATVVAHGLNQAARPMIYAYDQGATMVGMTAPARRVGFFLTNSTADVLTTQGWQLFDAAVNWLAGGQTQPPAPSAITWVEKAPNPLARMEALGLAVNGRLYVFGGYTTWPNATTRSDYYTPATNTWTQIADMPEPITHAQVVTDGTKIYFVGGFFGAYPSPSTGRVWIYTIANNTWSQGPSLPQALGAGAAAIVGRNLYYFGGTIRTTTSFSDQANSYVLNLDTLSGWQSLPAIPTRRNHMSAIAYNNKIYVFGGQVGGEEGSGNLDVVEMYDVANNLWVPKANMPIKKGHTSAFLYNGYIYVIGGTINDGNFGAGSNSVLRYNPVANTWAAITSLPAARKQPVSGVINGKFYVTTGQLGTTQYNTTWEGTLLP
jgi:N-acetylneuraminic acid mutarotase